MLKAIKLFNSVVNFGMIVYATYSLTSDTQIWLYATIAYLLFRVLFLQNEIYDLMDALDEHSANIYRKVNENALLFHGYIDRLDRRIEDLEKRK